MKTQFRTELKNAVLIAVGLALCGLAYRMYLIPNDVAAGGFTGVGQLVNHLTGIRVGTVALCLNVPLFLLSMRSLGIRFGVRSLISMIGLSLAIDYLPIPALTNDVMLATVFGGALGGIGFGLVLRGNATTGGSDMLATLVHRHLPVLRVSVGVFLVDGLVIVASAFVFDASAAMYALIAVFLMNLTMDYVLEGPDSARSYLIVSDESEAIAKRIMDELSRGVTGLNGKGFYSGEEKQVLLCVIGRFEAMRLRAIIFSIDPKAFVVALNAHEVLGEGFKEEIRRQKPADKQS